MPNAREAGHADVDGAIDDTSTGEVALGARLNSAGKIGGSTGSTESGAYGGGDAGDAGGMCLAEPSYTVESRFPIPDSRLPTSDSLLRAPDA